MADDIKTRVPADPNSVNLNDPAEVSYWRKQYGCTEQQLRHAVAAAGVSAAKLKQYFRNLSRPRLRPKIGYD